MGDRLLHFDLNYNLNEGGHSLGRLNNYHRLNEEKFKCLPLGNPDDL